MAKRKGGKWWWPGDAMIEIGPCDRSSLWFRVSEPGEAAKDFIVSRAAARRIGAFLLGLNQKKKG